MDGTPIAGADVILSAPAKRYAVRSSATGAFVIEHMAAGQYDLTVFASNFQTLDSRMVGVAPGQTQEIDIGLPHLSAGSLTTLGTVRINGSLALSKASAATIELDTQALAGQGAMQLSDLLAQQIALTMTRPAGGAPGLPQTAALRGPDPSETVIDIDGHQVNNSNTGDFDLELLDPSEFQNVQVVYGIGPSSLVGANTQGGAINFHTIDPTPQRHGLVRFSAGSFGTFGETLQATGSSNRFGYALAYHRYTSAGEVNNYRVSNDQTGLAPFIGSGILATSTLLKLRYALGIGDGFIQASYRNTAAFRNLAGPLATPDDPSRKAPGALFSVLPDATSQTVAPAVSLDFQIPLGARGTSGISPAALVGRHEESVNAQSVPADVEALGNPYLFNQRDHVFDDSLTYQRALDRGSLTFGYDVHRESLSAAAALAPGPPQQSQVARSFVGRYEWQARPELVLTMGAYASRFDAFGSSLDPRAAFVWTPTANQVLRVSIGTAFRPPLLAERVFNPALRPERTTEYELGYERKFNDGPLSTHAVLNLYRTNLRDPIFFATDATGALTFLKNLGDVRYQGLELRLDKPLNDRLTVRGAYGVSIAYPRNNPFAFDPAAPNVVAGEQFQGIPPQKAQLGLTGRAASGLTYWIAGAYESSNNELNRPQYATVAAGLARTIRHTQIALTGRNLTNQFDDLFTLPHAGTPYRTPNGPALTNAFSLQGTSLTLTVTQSY